MSDSPAQQTNKVLRLIAQIEDGLLVAMLAAMIILAGMQIILRNVFATGFVETDALLKTLVLWVGMIGAVVASRERRHITIDVLSRFLAPRTQRYLEILIDAVVVVVCAMLAVLSMRMLLVDYEAGTTAFSGVPTWLLESILPLAFTIISLRYLVFCGLGLRTLVRGGAAS